MTDIVGRTREALTSALVIHTDIVVRRAHGVYVEDVSGRRFMDFTSGLATTNTGHNHPRVVEAILRQSGNLLHSGCMFHYESMVELADRLRTITPQGIDTFFFGNSGAEAVEGAMKLARHHTGRQGIISFVGGFHGRTFGALSLTTSNIRYRRKYHPVVPSVYHSPYPYCYRCFFGQRQGSCSMDCYAYLERLLKHLVAPDEVAAVIMEPVLGEGGYVVPPQAFLAQVRELCNRWGIMLVLDEVQTGMGRTGKWFASEHFGVFPDIMTMAKGIASGMPLSAFGARKEIMKAWPPGAHGTTFGGNPVSCAAAAATIDAIRDEGMLQNAAAVGDYALQRLRQMQQQYPCIGDVRGLGQMIGIEFVKDGGPDAEGVKEMVRRALEKGLVLLECGVDRNIIRLAPPLITTLEEMRQGLDILESSLPGAGGCR